MKPRLIAELPKELNYWFVNENGKIKILSDAIKTPEIVVDREELKIHGEWIFRRGNTVVRRDEQGRESTIDYPAGIIDFVPVDDTVFSVERKGKNLVYNGEKYSSFYRKFAFAVLEDKSKVVVFVDGKQLELEKPVTYRVTPSFINFVYNERSVVIDTEGEKVEFKRPDFYLGESSKGKLFQTQSGKIVAGNETLGVCSSSDAYYLGEASVGVVIICGNKAKYFYRGGWAYLSDVSSVQASFVNFNFVIVTDEKTTVYDGNLRRLFELNNVHAVSADRKSVYTITNAKKLYVIELAESQAVEVKQEGYSIVLFVDKSASLKLEKGLIKVQEAQSGDKLRIIIEPTKLSEGAKSQVEISDELTNYKIDVNIPPAEVVLDAEAKILMTRNGKVKDANGYYNALFIGKIRYKLPSMAESAIKVKVAGKDFSFNVDKPEGEVQLKVPLTKFDSEEEPFTVLAERNGYTEEVREYIAKVEEVKIKGETKTVERVVNASRVSITKSEDDFFEYEIVAKEQPEIYDNVIMAKEGEVVSIEGQRFEVKGGLQKVNVQRENYSREYYIYGVPDPVNGIKVIAKGGKLFVSLDLKYQLPVTAFYGTQMQTNTTGEFAFNLDPAYSLLVIKAYYCNMKFEFWYKLPDLTKTAVLQAIEASKILSGYLAENFGI